MSPSHAVLETEHCDLDIENNSRCHHTDLYEEERLIVRRGQPFNIIFHLEPGSKEFKLGETSFIVETGKPLLCQLLDTHLHTCARQKYLGRVVHAFMCHQCVYKGVYLTWI